ncbi:MAG: hypothetical protein JWQ85_3798, partial [Mucilaginibacter sp.]|nr:hypothetical protein [Mucilaginibacter sp.]
MAPFLVLDRFSGGILIPDLNNYLLSLGELRLRT